MRLKCQDYVHLRGNYFYNFIDSDKYKTINEYVKENKRDKAWGDEIEIRAMSELYQLPVEIYEYGLKPRTQFNEELIVDG